MARQMSDSSFDRTRPTILQKKRHDSESEAELDNYRFVVSGVRAFIDNIETNGPLVNETKSYSFFVGRFSNRRLN